MPHCAVVTYAKIKMEDYCCTRKYRLPRETAPHDGLRKAEKREMCQYGYLVNDSVGFMAVPFSAFGSTVSRKVAKLIKGMAKRQRISAGRGVGQLGEDNQFKPDGNMPPVLIC